MTSTSLYYTGYEMTNKEWDYEIAKKHFINDQQSLIPEDVKSEFNNILKEYDKVEESLSKIYIEIKKAKGDKALKKSLGEIEDKLIIKKYKLVNEKNNIVNRYPFIDRVKAQLEFSKMIENKTIKYYRGKIVFA